MAGQQNTLSALQNALKFEIEGKDFYTQAAGEATTDLGRHLLSTLASEEDYHRQVFTSIYEAIRTSNKWPDVPFHPDGGHSLRTILESIAQQPETARVVSSELDAVVKARSMEARTFDFYQEQKRLAEDSTEKEFYDKLARQEQQHNLALADYYEYLQNPAAWFVKKEHPTLD
jgi:rubrerythrin